MLAGILFLLGCNNCESKVNSQEKISKIISSMSLQQKAQLVIGTGMYFEMPDSLLKKLPKSFSPIVYSDDANYVETVEKIRRYLPGAAGVSMEFKELGITSQVLTDGPAGLRIQPRREGEEKTFYCTAFPIATMLASTWDTDLIYQVGQAMGQEVKEYGSDILLAPGMNIQRDPLCGRNFEYYSEDPLVTGNMAAAMVNGVQSNGVGTSVKHFVANNQETNRLSVNTIVSERALREIYLKGFDIALQKSEPWTVMSSYNKVNGVYTCESDELLTNVLRDDWNYQGYVMTDWTAGDDVVAQMKAGNDMVQPGTPKKVEEIIAAVKNGSLDEEVLDTNIRRILNVMLKSPRYNEYAYANKPNLTAHAEITRKAGADGIILLENRNETLPIRNMEKIAAFGTTSYEFISGGTGSGNVNEAYTVSLIEGLENGGFIPNAELKTIYETYISEAIANLPPSKNPFAFLNDGHDPIEEMKLSKSIAAKMAKTNDIALITIGRKTGEGGDQEPIKGDFYLNDTEINLIKNVTEAFHKEGKKSIVILNIGTVIGTASWKEIPDAVLLAWQPGQEGGNAVCDVISGNVNPSGKLAISFPVLYNDAPSSSTFPGQSPKSSTIQAEEMSGSSFDVRIPWEVVYEEDIYVGYRYYNTFEVPVSYEFGYGKSYTTFEYSSIETDTQNPENQITLAVDITNTGSLAGKEVVQIYVSAPDGIIEKPKDVLVAFAKTNLIEPGEKQTLNFTIKPNDYASFNQQSSEWIVEQGEYKIKVAASSKDVKKAKSFELNDQLVLGKVTKLTTEKREVNWLTKKH